MKGRLHSSTENKTTQQNPTGAKSGDKEERLAAHPTGLVFSTNKEFPQINKKYTHKPTGTEQKIETHDLQKRKTTAASAGEKVLVSSLERSISETAAPLPALGNAQAR